MRLAALQAGGAKVQGFGCGVHTQTCTVPVRRYAGALAVTCLRRHMTNLHRRRQLKQWSTWAACAVCPLPLAHAAPPRTLRILTWPGYAEPEVVQAFEAEHNASVELTVVESDDALWQHMSASEGAGFDVLAINTAELQRCIQHDWVAPLAPTDLPNIQRQLPRFQRVQDIPGLVHGGRTMAIPFTYADMGLVYSRTHFPQGPQSVQALWDAQWRGRVLAHDGGVHNFSLAALALGLPSPFRLAERDWPQAVARLIALRRNVGGFYSHPDESLALFQRRQAVLMLANYGSQQLKLFQAAGLDVGYAIPEEGALAWLDCWAITRAAAQPKLAAAWINHVLGKPASDLLVERQGLANTTSPTSYPQGKLLWLQPPENSDRRQRLWARILSGDRAAKVLAA